MPVEYRSPRSDAELEDAFRCSYAALGGGARFFERIVRLDPWFRRENTRACFVDGRVASVVQVFERPLRIGRCTVRAGCLGSVGTHPDFRRRGYGLGTLQDTARYLRGEGFDLSLFFTVIHRHYARAGWTVHPTTSLLVDLPASFPEPAPGVQVAPCAAERDRLQVRAIYDAENARRTGTVVRTPEYWARREQWNEGRAERTWVARRDETAVAYACEEEGDVREMGRLPGQDEALTALLTAVWAPLRAEGRETVRVRAPSGGRRLLEAMGCRATRRESPAMMVRLVNLRSLMSKLAPLLTERARAAGENRDVRFGLRTEADACTVEVRDGRVRVVAPAKDDVVLPLSQTQAIGLLMDHLTIDHVGEANGLPMDHPTVAHVGEANGLAMDEPTRAAVRPLFPKDAFHHWTWDRRMHAE